jgi:hypothetical protein
VTALSRSLLVELAITPVLLVLLSLLPSRARPDGLEMDREPETVAVGATSA